MDRRTTLRSILLNLIPTGMDHGPLFAAKEPSGNGEEDAEGFADQRLESDDSRNFHAVEVTLRGKI